jgi:PAS domain S-box-containing protein
MDLSCVDRKECHGQDRRGSPALRAAVENETHIVFFTDRDGAFTYVNRSFERITGYAASEVLGKTVQHPEIRPHGS